MGRHDATADDVEAVAVIVVAIDGPAGSGKSSVAAAVAAALGIPHVDTGAYYRAATLAALRAGASVADAAAVLGVIDGLCVERHGARTFLDGEDVEDEIRGPAVTAAVSSVARHPGVRAALLDAQRAGIGPIGAVVEGRDAGTVVVPDADLKVWLDATPEERGRRRALQRGDEDIVSEHVSDLRRRDAADARQMARADGAVVLDTTGLTLEDVVEDVVQRARAVRDRRRAERP